MSLRILIVGGYGTFGARLVRLLADEAGATLLVAGRSADKARAFCAGLAGTAVFEPVAFDRESDVAAQLAALRPDVLIDASGPFQRYGSDPYRVVRACIAAGVNYIDLADATAFVRGIGAFDAAAQAANVFVLSGASTFPALSSAVVRRLARGMTVRSIAAGIAPSPQAGIGRNVVEAIASYAGKPIAVRRGGEAAAGYGLTGVRRVTVAPPGNIPLRPRAFALVDVPDLALAAQDWPDLENIWTGAGTAPALWFRGLSLLARLVRWHLLPSLAPFARLFHWVGNRLVWGEARGGMFVTVRGDAQPRSWHMIADGDSGPFVPAMAAYVLLAKCLRGERPPAGAAACSHALELDDFEAVFARKAIVSGIREDGLFDVPLYRRYLGSAWENVPEAIRAMHDGNGTWHAQGRAKIERGRGVIASLAAAVFGFPKAGDDVPVDVRFEAKDGREIWTRSFAGKPFASVQAEGRWRSAGLLCERFGPLNFAMALLLKDGELHLIQRGWSAFGIPLPMALAPVGTTFESAPDGRFHFHVEIGFAWTGLIVRYRGWLVRAG